MTHHEQLSAGGWNDLSFLQQMGNIGSEVHRAQQFLDSKLQRYEKARERMLELIDLTLQDSKATNGQKMEVARMREVLCDYFYGANDYNTDAKFLDRYFLSFGMLANQERT